MKDNNGKRITYQILVTILALVAIMSTFLPYIEVGMWGFGIDFSLMNFFETDGLELVLTFANVSTTIFTVIRCVIIGLLLCDALAILCAWMGRRGACWLILIVGMVEALISGAVIVGTLMYSSTMGESVSSQIGNNLRFIAGIILFISALLLRGACEKKTQPQSIVLPNGWLVGMLGEYEGDEIPVDDTSVIIGRDPSCCNLILRDDKVSRKHCSIAYDGERKLYLVRDFSSNGTFLSDGTALNSEKANELKPGVEIRIGEEQVFALK